MTSAARVADYVHTVYVNANDPVGLYELLTVELGLPDIGQPPKLAEKLYEVKAYVYCGVVIEISRFRDAADLPGGPSAAYLAGVRFDCENPRPTEVLAERGVPATEYRWASDGFDWQYVHLEGIAGNLGCGLSHSPTIEDPSWSSLTDSGLRAASMRDWMQIMDDRLAACGGGALQLTGAANVTVKCSDLTAQASLWREVLAPNEPCRGLTWKFDRDPTLTLVGRKGDGVALELRSLDPAAAVDELRRRGLLFDRGAMIAPGLAISIS